MKMKKFEQFENSSVNESDEEEYQSPVKVKDLIEFLSKLDPEMNVSLDHDGWSTYNYKPKDVQDLIEKRGIFDVWSGGLIINN